MELPDPVDLAMLLHVDLTFINFVRTPFGLLDECHAVAEVL